ncbi:hypothetical protein K456DRAFT_844937 [Colletotrichum gloeosporioides 23]|nr:hypothetical protein K456DRAFT_844937 [Colletotrichum gloeosporioides 23]
MMVMTRLCLRRVIVRSIAALVAFATLNFIGEGAGSTASGIDISKHQPLLERMGVADRDIRGSPVTFRKSARQVVPGGSAAINWATESEHRRPDRGNARPSGALNGRLAWTSAVDRGYRW